MLKIALVVNERPPYRIPIYNRIARMPDIELQVITCCEREPNRHWDLPPMEFNQVILRERITTVNGRYIHNNPDVVARLREFAPDVIVTNGFNPTHLYALAYAYLTGIPYVPMTDGTVESEQSLSKLHKLLRRLIYAKARAYVFASLGGKKLYESYGVKGKECFQSHLCTDNDAYLPCAGSQYKRYDFIFCGRMVPEKSPLFVIEVAAQLARKLDRKVSILFVGSGSQLEEAQAEARRQSDLVDAVFHGFASQTELPALYHSAKIFLFPTVADVWGVVANEACAAGLPVLVTPHAGVAGELVVDGQNGYVCELDAGLWAERAHRLLTQPALLQEFSRQSRLLVDRYSFDAAANGLANACRRAARRSALRPKRDASPA